MKTYTLRPEYEGVLVGGTVVSGPNGEAINVMDALKEGDGKISTDSVILQASLESYYGSEGLVFDVSTVDPVTGEETLVERPEPQAPVLPGASSTPSQEGVKAGNAPAEHGDQSDYATFSPDELRSTLQERDLNVTGRPSKDNMIKMLEEDDEKRLQEGASDGS